MFSCTSTNPDSLAEARRARSCLGLPRCLVVRFWIRSMASSGAGAGAAARSIGYVGVREVDSGGDVVDMWQADIDLGLPYKVFLGRFESPAEAAAAYDARLVAEGRKPVNNTTPEQQAAAVKRAMGVNGKRGSTSLYAGVSLDKKTGRWQAAYWVSNKCHVIGSYDTEMEAAAAMDNSCERRGRQMMNGTREGGVPPVAATKKSKHTRKSRWKGVSYHKTMRRWTAYMYLDGQSQTVGHFPSEILAADAFNAKCLELGKPVVNRIDPAELEAARRAAGMLPSTEKRALTSRFTGVSWDRKRREWRANISVHHVNQSLGAFKHEVLAAQAYNEKCRELGRLDKLNRIDATELQAALADVQSPQLVMANEVPAPITPSRRKSPGPRTRGQEAHLGVRGGVGRSPPQPTTPASARRVAGPISPYHGVSFDKVLGKWRAEIIVGRKHELLGLFDDDQQAAGAYDARCLQLGRAAPNNVAAGRHSLSPSAAKRRRAPPRSYGSAGRGGAGAGAGASPPASSTSPRLRGYGRRRQTPPRENWAGTLGKLTSTQPKPAGEDAEEELANESSPASRPSSPPSASTGSSSPVSSLSSRSGTYSSGEEGSSGDSDRRPPAKRNRSR